MEDFMFVKRVTQMDGTSPIMVITPANINTICKGCLMKNCGFEPEYRVENLSIYCKFHRCTIAGCGMPLAAFHDGFDQSIRNIKYCITHSKDASNPS